MSGSRGNEASRPRAPANSEKVSGSRGLAGSLTCLK
jgi:hypothetical protein